MCENPPDAARDPDDMLRHELTGRFFRYLSIPSQSDAAASGLPSTPGQRKMADALARELATLPGIRDVHLDDDTCCVTARLPGTVPQAPAIGFVAHLDTVDVGLAPEIRPQILRYEGADLCLNAREGIWLRAADHPELDRHAGQEVIFGDGSSVLGADNKAAIATIMTLLARLPRAVPLRGDVVVAFVPDEEIGLNGARALDLARFPADFAYTIDACALGEMVYETFNAVNATIRITGVPAHPMSAKGRLVNPVTLAAEFMSLFDPMDVPEQSDGRQGYFLFTAIEANGAEAVLSLSLRDFDWTAMAARRRTVLAHVERMERRHPRAGFSCVFSERYRNIAESLPGDDRSVSLLTRAMTALRIAPKVIAMRGSTDGAVISARGIPTPNYFTGALNFHSRFECLPVADFLSSYRVTEQLVRLAGADACG
ncbi:peptidase T [Gluconacetobacter tumulicola]|nr:peptidase T [Gluconacetobacter tumulicola]